MSAAQRIQLHSRLYLWFAIDFSGHAHRYCDAAGRAGRNGEMNRELNRWRERPYP